MLKISIIASLLALPCLAAADARIHVSTDIVTWDAPTTEVQCLAKGQAAIVAIDPKLSVVKAGHAAIATKDAWVFAVDCLQSYKLNGAYVTLVYTGTKPDDYDKAKTALSKGLGGNSELYK